MRLVRLEERQPQDAEPRGLALRKIRKLGLDEVGDAEHLAELAEDLPVEYPGRRVLLHHLRVICGEPFAVYYIEPFPVRDHPGSRAAFFYRFADEVNDHGLVLNAPVRCHYRKDRDRIPAPQHDIIRVFEGLEDGEVGLDQLSAGARSKKKKTEQSNRCFQHSSPP